MSYDIEVKPASKNAWFTPAESNNYYKARYSRDNVATHWWGDGTGADNHDNIVNYFLAQAQAGVKSVNYVCSDKKITLMVDPDNVAWCTQNGNPVSVSIEFQPTLSDEGYKRAGWLIASIEKKYGHKLNIKPHSFWFATSCPGTIDLNRLRSEADAATAGSLPAAPSTPTPARPVAEATGTGSRVFLPGSVDSWTFYKEGSGLRKGTGDVINVLRPSLFGGLTYDILGWVGDYAVIIKTQDYGRGVIWIKDTDAQILGRSSVTPNAAPKQPLQNEHTISLSASVERWRIYDLGVTVAIGNERGFLLPMKYGGLTYDILDNPSPNVYTIQTQSFGKVNIYADKDATVK